MMISNPMGMPGKPAWVWFTYVGIVNGAGGVYVGKPVGTNVTMNCAAKVGSIVAVNNGVGVGGGSTMGNEPGVRSTKGA